MELLNPSPLHFTTGEEEYFEKANTKVD